MKRKLVVYLAGLLTVLSVGFGSAQFSDVPAGHWAREAVERIAQRGLITGFPDGTFRGNQNLTRYQAALIIDRLLQQLAQQQPGAAPAPSISEEDLAAIRNAVQELAAELAALGVRVSALEDNSATKDDVAALQAAIDELKGAQSAAPAAPAEPDTSMQDAMDNLQQQLQEQIDSLQAQIDELKAAGETPAEPAAPAAPAEPADNSEVQGQIDSLQEQIDTLQQQIDELSTKMDEMSAAAAEPEEPGVDPAAVAELSDRVEAASVAADTALAQAEQLAERLGQAEGRVDAAERRMDAAEGNLAALQTQVEADADSIRALNELAVLLNQDVLSLQDRATALEKTLADVDFDSFATKEDVSAIQEFATALRGDLVRLSDRVSALDSRVGGIDTRLAAVEGTRPTLTGAFNARYGYRVLTGNGNDFDIDRLFPAAGFAGDNNGADINGDADTNAGGSLTLGIRRAATTTSGFNFTDASVVIGGLFTGDGSVFGLEPGLRINSMAVNGNVDGQAVSMRYNRSNTFRLTPYFMNNSGDSVGRGFLITANLSKALLAPNFSIVLGSTAASAAGTDDYFGIRGQISLLGLNVGISYGENNARNTGVATSRALAGVDFSGSLLGFINLQGEAINSNRIGTNAADSLFYTQAGLGLGPISLRANYRSVDTDFGTADWNTNTNNTAGLSRNDGDRIFNPGTAGTGFGIIADANLGFITLNGYFDSKSDYGTGANPQTAFGVGANLPLFAGLSLTGYFNSLTKAGAPSGDNPFSNQGPATRAAWGSNLGVQLTHNGASPSALIGGLNLGFEFRNTTVTGGARTDLVGNASYALGLGFLTLTPNFRFHSFNSTVGGEAAYTTTKFGIQATTTAFNLGLFTLTGRGAFATRSTSVGAGISETIIRAGVTLGNFLLPGANLLVDYGSGSGTNITDYNVRTDGDQTFNNDSDRLVNGPGGGFNTPLTAGALSGTVSGFQLRYEYAGWGVWYGNFSFTEAATSSSAQGFRIFYSLSF